MLSVKNSWTAGEVVHGVITLKRKERNMILRLLFLMGFLKLSLSVEPKCDRKERSFIVLDVAEDLLSRAKRFLPKCGTDSNNPIFVTVCEHGKLHVQCQEGKVVKVISANYGRTTLDKCITQLRNPNVNCVSINTEHIVRNICERKHSCTIEASHAVFGDPCPYTEKYFEMKYLCVPDNEVTNINVWSCENKDRLSSHMDAAQYLISESKKAHATRFEKITEKETDGGATSREPAELEGTSVDDIVKGLDFECHTLPKDCFDILQSGMNKSGVYIIWPKRHFIQKKPLNVYCDMDTDGGGWTVIQRRGQFSTPKDFFYKDWNAYKKGFGNIREEFWLGNDNIYDISSQANYAVRFDLKDDKGNTAYAHYSTFWIDDEKRGYTLHIDHYSGDAGDSMDGHKNEKFSTKDRDNDKVNEGSCSHIHKGAWWYRNCYASSLNGLNQPGVDAFVGILWFAWRKDVSLAGSEIKLRPR